MFNSLFLFLPVLLLVSFALFCVVCGTKDELPIPKKKKKVG